MTSSRRHFVFFFGTFNSWSYLHNGKFFLIHIQHDQGQYPSGQFPIKKRAHMGTSARQCARKISKCSKSSQIHFGYVSGHFKHFIKNRAKHAFLRVFVRSGQTKNNSSYQISNRIFLIFFRTIWYHVYLFMTIIDGISVRLIYMSVRARSCNTQHIWPITSLYLLIQNPL